MLVLMLKRPKRNDKDLARLRFGMILHLEALDLHLADDRMMSDRNVPSRDRLRLPHVEAVMSADHLHRRPADVFRVDHRLLDVGLPLEHLRDVLLVLLRRAVRHHLVQSNARGVILLLGLPIRRAVVVVLALRRCLDHHLGAAGTLDHQYRRALGPRVHVDQQGAKWDRLPALRRHVEICARPHDRHPPVAGAPATETRNEGDDHRRGLILRFPVIVDLGRGVGLSDECQSSDVKVEGSVVKSN